MLNIPVFPEQIPLGFEHFPAVVSALDAQAICSSDHAFYNLMGWYERRHTLISRVDSRLIADVEGNEGGHVFLGPFGSGDIKAPLERMLSHLSDFGASLKLSYVPQKLAEQIERCMPVQLRVEQREDFDYLYKKSDLSELPGRKYQSRRNFINRLNNSLTPKVEIYDAGAFDEVWHCLESWYEFFGHNDPVLEIEKLALSRILPQLEKIRGLGVVLRIDGRIAGFSIASPITEKCWMISIEKADREIKGLYQYINWAMANRLPDEVIVINRESDLGIEGLRAAKLRYHPFGFEEKYSISF